MPKHEDGSILETFDPTKIIAVGVDAQEQHSLEHIYEKLVQVSKKLDQIPGIIERCLAKSMLSELLPSNEEVFKRQAQHGPEHRAIAKRCCDLYVKDHERFFIQGSPLGLELAREISRRNTTGCYIATNSTFIKTILKPRCVEHGVLDFSGGIWDRFDGAEVFLANDQRYWPAFQNLFKPTADGMKGIDIAFVAPEAVCPEKGPFFHRCETACLVDTIWNVPSTKIAVMASAENVHASELAFPEYPQMFPGWRNLNPNDAWGHKIQLITAGRRTGEQLDVVVEAYRESKENLLWQVDWLNDKTGKWDDSIQPKH